MNYNLDSTQGPVLQGPQKNLKFALDRKALSAEFKKGIKNEFGLGPRTVCHSPWA